ncbi:MAG: MFS transporter [Clostridia bacterium]
MENSKSNKTYGIVFKDKIGYAMGDAACALSFSLIGSYLQMFYTDVLYISTTKIMVLFMVARVWDAINDPLWGMFIDKKSAGKNGKFRPYLRWLSVPVGICAVLMFTKIPGLTDNQYLIYAYVTYIGYGMMYTAINIPYGSLASVITTDEGERSSLSVFRSIGAGLGGLPSQILLPLMVYSTVAGTDVLDGNKLTIGVACMSVLGVIAYNFCYKNTKERVVHTQPQVAVKNKMGKTIFRLFTNRAFVSLCVASMLLIALQQYNATLYNYLFKSYFERPELYTLVTIFTYLPMAVLIPFASKMVKRWGKKELCGWGAVFSVFANLGLYLLHTESVVVFFAMCFLSGLGISFFTLEVWAIVTDLVDYQETLTGKREEGIVYASFSFTRKLGQAIAGVLGTGVLGLIGYDAHNITDEVIEKMYDAATIVPTILALGMAISLVFFFPLTKKKLGEIYSKKAQISTESDSE